MSYILDALRKADSERERGEVPGLHAQTAALPTDERSGSHVNQKLLLAVGVLTALLLGVLVWLMWGRSEAQPDRPQMPPDQAGMGHPGGAIPQQAMAAPPPAMAPQPTPPAIPVVPATPSPTAIAPRTYPPAIDTLQTNVPPATATAPAPALVPEPVKTNTTTSGTTKPPHATTGAAVEAPRLYRFQELPESVRRDIPTLTIGGAMYSETPASRMLIINSQVLHEGDKLSADLTLDEIKLKSAVFRFRTYRYVVSY